MIHVDLNHPSTSPLKSSASAAALDSFTWDVGGDDPFGTATTGASGMGPDDPLGGGDMVGDAADQMVGGHSATDFRPEEFLNVNDDLEDVMNLQADDVGDGLSGMVDPLGGSAAASSSSSFQPRPHSQSQVAASSMTNSASMEGNSSLPPSSTDSTFLASSPNLGDADRSSSLSPVPETNSPSGHGEGGSAGDGADTKEVEPPTEDSRKEEEEEEEVSAAAKVETSRQSSPLSPLTPPADEDGEGEGEGEEKKEGEKKAEEKAVVPGRSAKSLPQQQKMQPHAPQYQQQKQLLLGRQTTKSPLGTVGNRIPLGAASTFMQQHQQLRPSPDTAISTPDLISPSNNHSRDPKVVKVLDLNVELLK